MKKLLCIFGFVLYLCVQINAQSQSSSFNFTIPECQGDFPAVLQEVLNTPRSEKTYNALLVRFINEGRILYGTPINDYIDKIADNLLQEHQQLREQIHCYVLLSTEVNAWTLKNNIVLVSTGLLAQVTNEAEIAFVLAHEFAHVYLKHLDQEQKKSSKKDNYISKYLKYHRYSREQEIEADKVGLTEFYKKSPYTYEVLDGIYDVLKYADLPFDEVPFKRTEVEPDFFQFPDNYFLANVTSISDRSGILDTLSTHPNVEKRREFAKAVVSKFSDNNGVKYQQDEALFKEINRTACYLCIDLFLQYHQYDKAFYNAHVLQKRYSQDEFLQKACVSALYGVSKHKRSASLNGICTPYKQLEGEIQQVSYFFSKLTRVEWSVFALRYAWQAYKQYPENKYYQQVVFDLMKDIFNEEKMQYIDFCDYPQGTSIEDINVDTIVADTLHYENKYERLKNTTNAMVLPNKKFKMVNYMLVDIHRDSLFFEMVNKAKTESINDEILNAIATPGEIAVPQTLLIVPPIIRCYSKKKERVNAGQRQSEEMFRVITSVTQKSNIKVVVDDKLIPKKTLNTQHYNEIIKWQRWLKDFSNNEGISMPCYTVLEIDEITDSLENFKVCFVVGKQNLNGYGTFKRGLFLVVPILSPMLLPVGIANFCIPIYETQAKIVITDILTGKTQLLGSFNNKGINNPVMLKNYVYTQFCSFLLD